MSIPTFTLNNGVSMPSLGAIGVSNFMAPHLDRLLAETTSCLR